MIKRTLSSGPLLHARSHGLTSALLAVAALVTASVLVPTEPVTVPTREVAATSLPALIPVLPGLLCGACFASPDPSLEGAADVRRRTVPSIWLLVLTATFAILTVATVGPLMGGIEVPLRNLVIGLGLTALTATVAPPSVSWLPIGVYAGLNGIYGTRDFSLTPEPWAVLMQPAGSPGYLAGAVLCLMIGSVVWLRRARPQPGPLQVGAASSV